jgi:hypothetical protein
VLTRPEQPLQIRKIIDEGKILLVNLSKGRLGEDSASLFGGLLVTTIGLAAFSRAEIPEAERRAHWFYVDEFQSFTTLSLANMLSELRKYRVGMTAEIRGRRRAEPAQLPHLSEAARRRGAVEVLQCGDVGAMKRRGNWTCRVFLRSGPR